MSKLFTSIIGIEQKIKIKDLYISGLRLLQIAKIYNVSHPTIAKILDEMSVPRRNISECQQIYKINQDFFEVIDSELKAYIFGYLLADGCVKNKPGNKSISIYLNPKDIEIIYLIRKALYPNNDKQIIYVRENLCGLFIRNIKIVSDLCFHGCIPNKSYFIEYPKHINSKYIRHMLRGYFDGDGCAIFNPKKNICRVYFFGHKNFTTEIKKILNDQKIQFSIKPHQNTKFMEYLYIDQTESICKIYNYLYNESEYFLKRKKQKIIDFFKHNIINTHKFKHRIITNFFNQNEIKSILS